MTGIKTLEQKEIFAGYLELLSESLFEKRNAFARTLKNKIPLPYCELIKARMTEHSITAEEKWKLKPLLLHLEDELNKLTPFSLTIAFKPDESSIDKLYAWINTNLDDNLILDLSVNPDLVGGATISYQGLYADYSLKKKLARISIDKLVKPLL